MTVWPSGVKSRGESLQIPMTYPVVGQARQVPYELALPNIELKPTRIYKRFGNCIAVVRAAGYYVPRTKDGYARTVPVTSTKLPPEGIAVVIKTRASWTGHIAVAINRGGKLITTIDSAFGAGYVVPLEQYAGYI